MNVVFLLFDISNFWTLNWYYIIAVIISVSGLIVAIKNYRKGKTGKLKSYSYAMNTIPSTVNTNNSPINIVTNISAGETKITNHSELISTSDEKSKSNVKILFIDDNHADYKMVSILKRAGWINTKAVKDITDLDNYQLTDSDIIFVDINGVGTTMFEDQGLGLASAIKTKYPLKKVVIYSAETAGDRFHKALRQVDDCLAKNAEPYQFINLVESLSRR